MLDREGITKSEREIRERLSSAEKMVKELKQQREQEEGDFAPSLSDLNYHNGKVEGLKLALAIVLSNKYSAELDNLMGG